VSTYRSYRLEVDFVSYARDFNQFYFLSTVAGSKRHRWTELPLSGLSCLCEIFFPSSASTRERIGTDVTQHLVMTKRSYRDDVRGVSAVAAHLRRARFFCMGAYFDHRPSVGLSVRPAGQQLRRKRLTAQTLSNGRRPRLSMQVRDADTGAALLAVRLRRRPASAHPLTASASHARFTRCLRDNYATGALPRYQRRSRPTIINSKLKIVYVTHVIDGQNGPGDRPPAGSPSVCNEIRPSRDLENRFQMNTNSPDLGPLFPDFLLLIRPSIAVPGRDPSTDRTGRAVPLPT